MLLRNLCAMFVVAVTASADMHHNVSRRNMQRLSMLMISRTRCYAFAGSGAMDCQREARGWLQSCHQRSPSGRHEVCCADCAAPSGLIADTVPMQFCCLLCLCCHCPGFYAMQIQPWNIVAVLADSSIFS